MRVINAGCHVFEIMEDIIHIHWIGRSSLSEVQQAYPYIEEILAQKGRCLVLMDMRQGQTPDAETRKWLTEWWTARDRETIPLACYGLNALMQTAINLMLRAAVLLGRRTPSVTYVATEAEARSWLYSKRAQICARQATTQRGGA
jgi:hypothetical protein